MKGFVRLAPLLFVAIPLGASAAGSNDTAAKIDRYMQAAAKIDHFMGSVLVARDGHVLIAKGYGMADVENGIPNTPETEFRIGSVTKQFTAMAILQLQAKGKLDVQDPVCKYVPKCPKDWAPIKIQNLLTHTSGIPNFTSFPDFDKVDRKPHTPAELLALFEDKPLDFKPGAKFSYSNSNYEVLGYVVEKVSGETYGKFLQQHIFGPLGMQNSGYDSSHPTAKNHAKGYEYSDGEYKPAEYVDMSVPFAAGALYSTVRDLYKWDRALAAGRLIPESLQKQMFAPQVPVGGELAKLTGGSGKVHYGYGWFVSSRFGHLEYSHEGGIQGFTSLNSWYPDPHVYIIVLDNMTSPDVFAIGDALSAIVFGEKYEMPQRYHEIRLPAKDLQKFVGQYRLAPRVTMAITRDGDQLSGQLTGQSALPIYPESKTRFFLKAVRAEIEFKLNDQGEVTGLVLDQNGRQVPARKLAPGEAAEKPKAPTAVSLPASALQRFVGTYRLAPDFYIEITRDGGQLMEQATGQGANPIYPESKTEFFLKVVDAQISFVTDDRGNVTGLVLHQNGRDIPGKRIE